MSQRKPGESRRAGRVGRDEERIFEQTQKQPERVSLACLDTIERFGHSGADAEVRRGHAEEGGIFIRLERERWHEGVAQRFEGVGLAPGQVHPQLWTAARPVATAAT